MCKPQQQWQQLTQALVTSFLPKLTLLSRGELSQSTLHSFLWVCGVEKSPHVGNLYWYYSWSYFSSWEAYCIFSAVISSAVAVSCCAPILSFVWHPDLHQFVPNCWKGKDKKAVDKRQITKARTVCCSQETKVTEHKLKKAFKNLVEIKYLIPILVQELHLNQKLKSKRWHVWRLKINGLCLLALSSRKLKEQRDISMTKMKKSVDWVQ